jgi:hypothetical protein
MLELPTKISLSETESPNVPYLFVGDEGCALNRNLLRSFGVSNLSVKNKSVLTIACADCEGMWNVLLAFRAING